MSPFAAAVLVATMASVSGVMVAVNLMACRYLREAREDDE